MAPSSSSREPSHFEVLSLTPKSLDGQDPSAQTKTVKQAYRRALLKHHPDKNQPAQDEEEGKDKKKKDSDGEEHFSVDQITEAFTVLSDTRQRREYVRSLQTESRSTFSSSSNNTSSSANQNYNYHKSFNFKHHQSQSQHQANRPQSPSGVEEVDLDDVKWDGKRRAYYQPCARCGAERGYSFKERDLDEGGEDGELMVQCAGCSLWLRVLFDEAGEDEEEAVDGSKDVGQRGGEEVRHDRSGSASGKSGGWSWKLNFGISIGGGVSASASAGRK
ncbi:CSL zinc finger-domain-containing protein [Pestalotiopsis sp. NC0098]|nr:CSL zinc finger-domain-containing protein [Pestalotiopsis sp. NC0098]